MGFKAQSENQLGLGCKGWRLPGEFLKEGVKSVLGKRMSSSEESSQAEVEQRVEVKRVKNSGD